MCVEPSVTTQWEGVDYTPYQLQNFCTVLECMHNPCGSAADAVSHPLSIAYLAGEVFMAFLTPPHRYARHHLQRMSAYFQHARRS